MTFFYTTAQQFGDKIFVRGYDKGRPYMSKVDFYPTLFVNSKNQTKWRTLDGKCVDEVKPGTIKETKEFVKKYEDVSGFSIYGNTNYGYQYISDTYEGDVNWDMDIIKMFAIDIETATESGFPDIRTANEEILLITVKDLQSKRIMTFGYSPTGEHHNNYSDDVTYQAYSSESSMLKDFIIWWQQNYPDVITGWNTEFFDIPYLVNRIARELGDTFVKKISPWGIVNQRNTYIKGNEEQHYDIFGISHLDYLELYKKFTYTKQESYRLDYICEQELGARKKENPGTDFRDFYTNYWDKFVEYNIHDVELIDQLDDKMHLIELCLTMAYNAKINYEDVFSQVRMWDNIIYNHLRKKGIVIPMKGFNGGKDAQFEGAYVKDPIIGAHKWVVAFDATSLYPSIMQTLNISPETYKGMLHGTTVEKLLEKQVDKPESVALAANGALFDTTKMGMYGEIIDLYMSRRKSAKKKMLDAQAQLELIKEEKTKRTITDDELLQLERSLYKQVSKTNNEQMAYKIALNSLYGASGSPYFRYFDLQIARAITLTGQYIIQAVDRGINRELNNSLKSDNYEYCFYCDTDSVYIRLEPIIEKYCAGKKVEEVITIMDDFSEKKLQPMITKICDDVQRYIGAYRNNISFKREVLADKAIWTAKKRYILNVHNSEGVQFAKPKLKVMGLEMVKSSTPAVIREKLKESITVILEGDQSKLHDFIENFRAEFKKLSVEDIAFPRGVNGIKTYVGSPIYAKGTPIHVRGSLLFNHHCKRLGLDKKYKTIREGDKIKFVYVRKPNPFQEDVIAFPQELPKEFNLHSYVDYDLQFDKVFLDAIQNVIEPLGWKTEQQSSIEDFFA